MGIFVSYSKEIQSFNSLGCNRMGNQIDSLDLGAIKRIIFLLIGPGLARDAGFSDNKVIFLKETRVYVWFNE